MDQVRGDGAREGEAHGAEPVRNQAGVGLVALIVAGDPHLVRADIRQQDVLWPQGGPDVPEHLLRAKRPLGVVRGASRKFLQHRCANASLLRKVQIERRTRSQPLVEHPQGMGEVADEFDVRVVVLVDLGGQKVRVDDPLVLVGIPEPGVVFHHVEAERNDQIRFIDDERRQVLRAEPDGEQAVVGGAVHGALRHEG